MEDQFFAKLREIQRKERANSSLARVGTDFYKRTHRYLDNIREIAVNDPFSEESDLLKNAQRVATEICEIREHKIADAAVMNIHRSYHLFQGKPQFDLIDTTPLNITDEEEKLYFSFVDVLKAHRRSISLDELTTDDNIQVNNLDSESNSEANSNAKSDSLNKDSKKINNDNISDYSSDSIIDNNKVITNNNNNKVFNNNIDKNDGEDDKVLKRLRTIKSAKIIADESVENIEKQINSPNTSFSNNKSLDESKNENNIIKDLKIENSTEIDKPKTYKTINNGNNTNNINKNLKTKQKSELSNIIGNEDDQFVDLDSLNVTESNFPDNFTYSNNSKSTVDKIANVMILVFSEINSIMGVDKKIYGPFKPQDIVVLPDINAEILVKNKMGRMVKS
ncbi:hypothetical protein SDC9_07686 [bioreactor metagenome]|uniref:Gins51 C-terminal domain-containing protein n=1 Tax=bioreactor metagenome TaxID=1076179 RepID=A0A644T6G2_9ZZZZ|nr:hypothetical protein [Methanobrevibacter sp.]MEA4956551.1 hypothetical protein [Methanobrevibacter sp.]